NAEPSPTTPHPHESVRRTTRPRTQRLASPHTKGDLPMPAVQEPAHAGIDTTALLTALTALKKGNYDVRLPVEWIGAAGKVADLFNEVVELNERMARELERLSRVVGKEGKLNQRAALGDVTGFWRDSIDSVNALITDLVPPRSETA